MMVFGIMATYAINASSIPLHHIPIIRRSHKKADSDDRSLHLFIKCGDVLELTPLDRTHPVSTAGDRG
jgi:hypothetical protein